MSGFPKSPSFGRSALALAVAAASAPVAAATFNVSNTNATGAGSFDQAIRDANDNPGPDEITFGVTGTIDLGPQYLEIMSGGITISGPGADVLTIQTDGSLEGQLLEFSGGINTVSGLRFAGTSGGVAVVTTGGTLNIDDVKVIGIVDAVSPMIQGALSDTTINIANSQFSDNITQGHALIRAASGASLQIQNTVITGNTSSEPPVLSLDQSSATIDGSTISNNTNTSAVRGGAVFIRSGSDLAVTNSTFAGNSADNAFSNAGGGAIASLVATTLTVSNSVFTGNSAGSGGVFHFAGNEGNSMVATVSGSTFTNNRADGFSEGSQGGVADLEFDASLTITDSVLSGNFSEGTGGAIVGQGQSILSATNTVFTNNSADMSGGALFLRGETTLSQSTLTGNTSGTSGGALHHLGTYAVSVEDSVIRNNSADNLGGGMLVLGANVSISQSLIADNSAAAAGGGLAVRGDATGGVQLSASTVSGNTAPLGGGLDVILADGQTLGLDNSTLSDNAGTNGPAVKVLTGASSGVVIQRSTLSGNTGGGDSPAVLASHYDYDSAGSYLTADSSTFSGNRASGAGAAISISSIEDVLIRHVTFKDNAGTGTGSVQLHLGASYAYSGTTPVTTEAPAVTISDSILSSSNANELYAGGDVFNSDGTSTVDADSLEPLVTFVDNISTQGQDASVGATLSLGAVQAVDPELGPLEANGGLTLTHLPAVGAPGIDFGEGGYPSGTDQRGIAAQGTPDIGAVEYSANTAPYLDGNLLAKLAGAPGKVVSGVVVSDLFADAESNNVTTVSVSGLPDGLTYTPGTDTVAGTLTTAGEYFVTVTVTDNGIPALETTVQGRVVVKKKNRALVASSGGGGSLSTLWLGALAALGLRRKKRR